MWFNVPGHFTTEIIPVDIQFSLRLVGTVGSVRIIRRNSGFVGDLINVYAIFCDCMKLFWELSLLMMLVLLL
jgi:hypothetical protein